MKQLQAFLDNLYKRFFSSTNQLQRIVVLLGIVLVLALATFGGYYYFDRFVNTQPTEQQISIAEAEQAVRDDPNNSDARLMLAETYMVYGRWDDAVAQAQQVLQVRPDEVKADFIIGIANANGGRPAEAIEPLLLYIESKQGSEMLGLDKRYLSALYYLGDSYLQLDRPDLAIEPLAIAVSLNSTDADAIYKLGMAYSGEGLYDDAIRAFSRAVEFVPYFTEAYEGMAAAYEAQGRTSEAEYARAMVKYSTKDYQGAYAGLLPVVQALPDFGPAFTGLGMACEKLEDWPCALDAYQRALALVPDDFTAGQGLQRVETILKK